MSLLISGEKALNNPKNQISKISVILYKKGGQTLIVKFM